MEVKHPGELAGREQLEANIFRGRLEVWRRVAVLASTTQNTRLFVLEPGDVEEKLTLREPFFVRGRFRVVERVYVSAAARTAWFLFQQK